MSEMLEESVLREQLAQACEPGGMLHRHSDVPEAAVIGRGRAMRTRRHIGYAGAAVSVVAVAAVGVAVALPTSVAQPHESSSASANHEVTVEQLDPKGQEITFDGDQSWVVGAGQVDGAKWRLLLRWTSFAVPPAGGSQASELCAQLIVGSTEGDTDCGASFTDDNSADPQPPVALTGESQNGSGLPYFQLGSVRADVAEVQVDLADGESLSLQPVTAHGKRYVAFAAPAGLDVSLLVAYDAHGTEIGQLAPEEMDNGMPVFDSTWSASPAG
jgi:hypothetical protein